MDAMAAELQAGIAASRTGKQGEARTYFVRVLKHDPRNEDVWLRLSGVMPTLEESLRCIEHLLTINPHNPKAREAQEVLRIRLLLEEAAVIRTPEPPASTPERRYLLGEALIEANVITPQQLDRALKEQMQLARKRKSVRLGEVLLRLKLVTPTQLEGALAAQIEAIKPIAEAGATGQIGAYLVQTQLITRAQLHQALAQQAELKRQGQSIVLGDILVKCGYIQREHLNRAMLEWQIQYNMAFR